VIAARRPEVLKATAREVRKLGARVLPVVADVTNPADVERFLADPVAWVARENGVPREVYVAWKADSTPRCSAETKRLRPCKNIVHGAGCGHCNLEAFAKLRGGYCIVHAEQRVDENAR